MNSRSVDGQLHKYGSPPHSSRFEYLCAVAENSTGARRRWSTAPPLPPDAVLSGGDPRQNYFCSPLSPVAVPTGEIPLLQASHVLQSGPTPPPGSTRPSAFYAAGHHQGFSRFDHQVGNLPLFAPPMIRRSSEAALQTAAPGFPAGFGNSQSHEHDTLESVVKKTAAAQGSHGSGAEVDYILGTTNNLGACTPTMGCYDSSTPAAEQNLQLSPDSRRHRRPPTAVHANPGATPAKTRIRWTQELHERFVESVDRLGGADKATPKGILKLMGSERLNIYHVKSHLQKYRIAKYLPESAEGIKDRRGPLNDLDQLDSRTSGTHITEALRLQLELQRRLHEQLEIQRNIQMRIEEQGRQLQKMFEQQQKATRDLLANQSMDVYRSDEEPISFGDVQTYGVGGEGSENTHFSSKIS